MISALLVGLAVRQDVVQFKFQPKVGEKYLYSLTMEDAQGKPQIPDGMKLQGVYKIAGYKDGWYTVHYFIESTEPDGKTESELNATYKVDAQMNSEFIPSGKESVGADAGSKISAAVDGCFGVELSPESVKVGDSWTETLDAVTLGKKFMARLAEMKTITFGGSGEKRFSLTKFDEKNASITTKSGLTLTIDGEENGTKLQAELAESTDQSTVIDRANGMPISIDRKFSLSIKAGVQSHLMSGTVHLVRIVKPSK